MTYSVIPSPGDAVIWGGAIIWSKIGKDGNRYTVFSGEKAQVFSPLVFRTKPDGTREWLQLSTPPREGVGCFVNEDVLTGKAYVTWMNQNERSFTMAEVPGYTARNVTTVTINQTNAVDNGARDIANQALNTANSANTKAQTAQNGVNSLVARVSAIEARKAYTDQGILDLVWPKIKDAVYADLLKANSGNMALIRAEIVKQVSAALTPEKIKQLIREVLAEK